MIQLDQTKFDWSALPSSTGDAWSDRQFKWRQAFRAGQNLGNQIKSRLVVGRRDIDRPMELLRKYRPSNLSWGSRACNSMTLFKCQVDLACATMPCRSPRQEKTPKILSMIWWLFFCWLIRRASDALRHCPEILTVAFFINHSSTFSSILRLSDGMQSRMARERDQKPTIGWNANRKSWFFVVFFVNDLLKEARVEMNPAPETSVGESGQLFFFKGSPFLMNSRRSQFESMMDHYLL